MSEKNPLGNLYPYAERFGVIDRMPANGRPRDAILGELREISEQEDRRWETGQCSGTMYAGDHAHYDFLSQAFGLFSHTNALQRDICPSATRFEGEIAAMTLDLLGADTARRQRPEATPCGAVTSGGTESILSALLAHREWAREERGVRDPKIVLPATAHPAFEKGAHLFGMEVVRAPVDPTSTQVDVDFVRRAIDARTVLLVGSAGNYPYGTLDPIDELSSLALQHGIGLHVDACLGGFVLAFANELGIDVPAFDLRLPGVSTISADTHKFGYGLKGTSVLLFREREMRRRLYFFRPEWPGGKYFSPGIAGSRSGGLLAATWAAMVSLGREGYRAHAKRIFEVAFAMQDSVRRHAELRIFGDPTFCFAFGSDVLDVYHVDDAMRERGWRFNGLQYPNALHFCVTRPQTTKGVAERFAIDLEAAVAYAKSPPRATPRGAAIYGGLPLGDANVRRAVTDFVVGFLDATQDVPGRE